MTVANGIIDSFGALKAELTTTLQHNRWAAQYAHATVLFEAAANRRLRVRQMETSTTLTTDANGLTALPTDYLLWRTVQWLGRTPQVEIDYVHPAYFRSTWIETDNGDPKIFRIVGDGLSIRPVDDTADIFRLHYYQKIPSITGSDAGTNWLIEANPDVYLAGVMTELAALQRNMEMAQLEKARRDEMFAEIIQLSALSTGATSSMVRTSEYF